MRVACRGDETTAELISSCCVEASRNFSISIDSQRIDNEHTNDQIRIKFLRNRHDDLVKCIHVITVAHALVRPGNVDVPGGLAGEFPVVWSPGLPPVSDSSTTMVHVPIFAVRIEFAVLVDVERDVQNIGVVIECLLNPITWLVSSAKSVMHVIIPWWTSLFCLVSCIIKGLK